MNDKTFNATMKKYFSESVEVAAPPSIVKQPAIKATRGQVYGAVGSFAVAATTFWTVQKIIIDREDTKSDKAISTPCQNKK